jgi:hypothetical protein
MTANKSVTANFTQNEYSLTVSISPLDRGVVTKSPNKPIYFYGETVILTAIPDPGWHFSSWSGDAEGVTNPLTFIISGNANITANFSDVYIIYLPMVMRN